MASEAKETGACCDWLLTQPGHWILLHDGHAESIRERQINAASLWRECQAHRSTGQIEMLVFRQCQLLNRALGNPTGGSGLIGAGCGAMGRNQRPRHTWISIPANS